MWEEVAAVAGLRANGGYTKSRELTACGGAGGDIGWDRSWGWDGAGDGVEDGEEERKKDQWDFHIGCLCLQNGRIWCERRSEGGLSVG